MKLRILYIVICCSLLWAGCFSYHLAAQTFTASASKTVVGAGEEFEVSFSIDANGSGFVPPSFSHFNIYSGPNASSSFSFVNGNVSQSISFSFTLAAKEEGTFTIEPASISVGGKTIKSNSLTIQVQKGATGGGNANANQGGNQGQPPPTPQGNNTQEAQAPDKQVKQNLFARIVPEKSKVYEGEELPVSIKVYVRILNNFQLQGFQDVDIPPYDGFYSEDVPMKGQTVLQRETVNGAQYGVATIKQNILFAQRSGKLTINPVDAKCIVVERVKSRDPYDVFSQFFGGSEKKSVYDIKSEPLTIQVLPLPHTDKNFSGAVGEYTVHGSIDRNSVNANDAVNLTLTISGSGDLKLVDSLPINFPPDIDHYDPKITDHITASANGVTGSRTFNYLLIPRHEGNYKLSSNDFVYFDPKKKEYVTLSLPEYSLKVAKGTGQSSTVTVNGGTSKEDIKLLGQDIRFIHTGHESAYPTGIFFLYSPLFYTGICLPILAFLGFIFLRRRYVEIRSDTAGMKMRAATGMAKKRLRLANKYASENKKEQFYEETLKALNGYLSDKFSIPVSDLSRDSIRQALTSKNVKEETVSNLIAAIDNCELARYAPAGASENLSKVYSDAIQLITQLEDEIKA
jgi:hypothetical protein